VEQAFQACVYSQASEWLLGELSCKERSDEAGQFVGKRAGSAAAVAQKGAKRRPEPRRRRCFQLPRIQQETDRAARRRPVWF